MGISAEEAASAVEKVQAIQRGKLARWQLAAQQAEAAVDAEEKAEVRCLRPRPGIYLVAVCADLCAAFYYCKILASNRFQ